MRPLPIVLVSGGSVVVVLVELLVELVEVESEVDVD